MRDPERVHARLIGLLVVSACVGPMVCGLGPSRLPLPLPLDELTSQDLA